MVVLFTEESVSAQTVSQVMRDLDQAVASFIRRRSWTVSVSGWRQLTVRRRGGSRVTHPAKRTIDRDEGPMRGLC